MRDATTVRPGSPEALIAERIANLGLIAANLPTYLTIVEDAADGRPASREAVLEAIQLLLDNLYRGVLAHRVVVPGDFWRSPLGLAIARAHTAVVPAEEVVSQAEAAAILGISRESVSQLVEAGKVRTIVREAAAPRSRTQAREMIYRSELARLKA